MKWLTVQQAFVSAAHLYWLVHFTPKCCDDSYAAFFPFTGSDGACFSFPSFTSTFLMVKLHTEGRGDDSPHLRATETLCSSSLKTLSTEVRNTGTHQWHLICLI